MAVAAMACSTVRLAGGGVSSSGVNHELTSSRLMSSGFGNAHAMRASFSLAWKLWPSL